MRAHVRAWYLRMRVRFVVLLWGCVRWYVFCSLRIYVALFVYVLASLFVCTHLAGVCACACAFSCACECELMLRLSFRVLISARKHLRKFNVL